MREDRSAERFMPNVELRPNHGVFDDQWTLQMRSAGIHRGHIDVLVRLLDVC